MPNASRSSALIFLALVLAACGQQNPTPARPMTPTLTPPSASVTPSPIITPTLAPPSPTVAGAGSPRLIGYYDGVDPSLHISDIPADRLTHLIYAFVKVSD